MDKDVPLIFTSKGNLPVSSLEYHTGWHIDDENIIFAEEYLLDGELVKNNVHVYKKKGQFTEGEEGNING